MNRDVKTAWTVRLPGRPPFPMVSGEGKMNYAQALAAARAIWPDAEVE